MPSDAHAQVTHAPGQVVVMPMLNIGILPPPPQQLAQLAAQPAAGYPVGPPPPAAYPHGYGPPMVPQAGYGPPPPGYASAPPGYAPPAPQYFAQPPQGYGYPPAAPQGYAPAPPQVGLTYITCIKVQVLPHGMRPQIMVLFTGCVLRAGLRQADEQTTAHGVCSFA